MRRDDRRWGSGRPHRDMELLVFGHAGAKVLVFPTRDGRFFEYEQLGIVASLTHNDCTMAVGCSLGAFQATSLVFQHPHLFRKLVALSGRYDLTLRPCMCDGGPSSRTSRSAV